MLKMTWNKKWKKGIGCMGAVSVLSALLAYPVLAADNPDSSEVPDNRQTTLTYSVGSDYMVTIPPQVGLNSELKITSTKANTEPGMAVLVRISSGLTDGSVTLDRENDKTGYKITAPVRLNGKTDKVTTGTVLAAFQDITETTEVTGGTLTFGTPVAADGKEVKAGSYSGKVTFVISYETYEEDGQ